MKCPRLKLDESQLIAYLSSEGYPHTLDFVTRRRWSDASCRMALGDLIDTTFLKNAPRGRSLWRWWDRRWEE